MDKTITKQLYTTYLELLKDIYFDGISKYPEIASMPSQYKRVLVEIPGNYPRSEDDRIKFEEDTIRYIEET